MATVFGTFGKDTITPGSISVGVSGYTTSGADFVFGDLANDHIDGGAGDDFLMGWTGSDGIVGGAGNDTLYGGPGDDSMRGSSGNDTIYGQDDSDTIYGEAGDDYLSSGQGRDVLAGGTGKDTFDFNSVSESPAFGAYDNILDFKWWEGDKIDLATIDADLRLPGDQAFNRNQLSYSGEVMTADVYGGADLQVKVVGQGFIPIVDVIA